MKKIILGCVISIFACVAGFPDGVSSPDTKMVLPLGTWQYGVYIGKDKIGNAFVTLAVEDGLYVSKLEMTIRFGDPIVTTREVTKEKLDFTPVSFSSSNVVVLKDNVTRDLVSAEINGKNISLKRGKDAAKTVTIEGPFVVSGNILTCALVNKKFAVGVEEKAMVYDPTIDEDAVVPVSEKVLGKETVDLPSGRRSLFHTVQSIGPLRSINNWVDEKGVSYKTTIDMLNSKIDMYLENKLPPKSK
ncbi:MAG TPA: hypothetical protein PKK43_01585 [Spirochaetota bacterium]|nr:hypothetical protein [Spirochaetota bacterium]